MFVLSWVWEFQAKITGPMEGGWRALLIGHLPMHITTARYVFRLSVTIFRTVVTFKTVIKDILKYVKSMAVKMHAVSKVIVPTRTRSRLNVKRGIC